MKKYLALALTLTLLLCLAACGDEAPSSAAPPPAPSVAPAPAPEPVAESVPEEIIEQEEVPGEAFAGGSFSVMIGTLTLETEWIPFASPHVVDNLFDTSIRAAGDVYYTLTDGKIRQYSLTGGALALTGELNPDIEYDSIWTDDSGVLYASGFLEDFVAFRDGEQIFAYSGPDDVSVHPSGEWGISWFSSSDVQKITIGDGALQTEDMSFPEVNSISHLQIGQDNIFVTGRSVDADEPAVFVYDLSGNLLHTLGNTPFGEDDSLGSVTAIVATQSGFFALDGNMRDIYLWQPDGTFIGTVEDSELFGTDYPWLSSAQLLPDGSILIGISQEREDESATEFIAYRLTGF